MTEYKENFITTYTGKKFHYLSPNLDEIDIIDIAHSLSLKCRFSGHVRVFYSVAEHSVRVAEIVSLEYQLEALLHDAAEAYMPDVPRPIKEKFGLRKFEDIILNKIYEKFGIVGKTSVVLRADDVLIATEGRDLMANMDDWAELPEPLKDKIKPLSSIFAKGLYLTVFKELYGGAK